MLVAAVVVVVAYDGPSLGALGVLCSTIAARGVLVAIVTRRATSGFRT
jgi:hypothetical protein